ncbi:MAG: hypothetical protein LBH06_06045 [Rikenellaceae bacterium]|jgi:hypothetical protein|nr:hypothetical protein [Rikenellaceae bacterium]
MKRILNIAVAVSALALASCGGLMGVDLTKQESVDKYLRAALEKHISPEAVIYELDLLTIGDFSVNADMSSVTYIAPNGTELEEWSVPLSGNQDPRKSPGSVTTIIKRRQAEGGVKLSEIDFSQIASNIAKAVAMLDEMEDDMEEKTDLKLDGISRYFIELSGDPAKIVHKFAIESKAGSELSTKNGRLSTVTNYYEFDFKANAAGNVEYVE